MKNDPLPPWPLPVMALVQAMIGSVLIASPKEPGGHWDIQYALIGTPFTIAGLVVLAFAVRNCIRLWRVEAWKASWNLVASLAVTTIFSLLVATGPLTIGEWRWRSLVDGSIGLYLLVVLVREIRRRLARRSQAASADEPGPVHADTH